MTQSNHQKQSGKAEEWRERFRKKFEIEYRQANFSAMVEDIESFIRQELSRQREEIEKLKKKPMTNKEINEVIRLNEGNIDYADIKDLDIRQAHGYNQAISDALAIIGGGK